MLEIALELVTMLLNAKRKLIVSFSCVKIRKNTKLREQKKKNRELKQNTCEISLCIDYSEKIVSINKLNAAY